MIIVDSIAQMQKLSREWQQQGLTIGIVPTMGFLHAGHLSLIDECHQHSDKVIVTIFVNPTQFAPDEDLASYPRDEERDCQLCEDRKVDAVFIPKSDSIYHHNHSTWVVEKELSQHLCGKSRPTHFQGVTTIVTKLFNATRADFAIFGQKDAQQALIIKRMVRDLNTPITIKISPIIRESDGLAMSSRNKYLTPKERINALAIQAGIKAATQAFKMNKKSSATLKQIINDKIINSGGKVDYIAIVSQSNLKALTEINEPCLIAIAAYYGNTRLIDNCLLT